MTSQPRPVRCIWLTEDMAICSGLRAAWDAAPADAAEALTAALDNGLHPYWALIALGMPHKCDGSRTCRASQHIHGCYAERALGYPHTEHADPAPPTENT